MLKIIKLSNNTAAIRMPNRGDAGVDLASAYPYIIRPGCTVKVETDLSVIFPEGVYGRICGRSSLALQGILVGGGVIDPSYTGGIACILLNLGEDDFVINRGDRIAQIVCEKFLPIEFKLCGS